MTTRDDKQFLTGPSLDAYLAQGNPSRHVLSEDPRCEVVLDPRSMVFELFTPVVGPEPDVAALQRVEVETVHIDGEPWFRLTVDARDIPHEAYELAVGIVLAMNRGATFAHATDSALANLRAVLAGRSRLSAEVQTGLLGELLVVRALLRNHGEDRVLEWWLGPEAEQHDFAFEYYDTEVKTTTSETRQHMIHGLGQLLPNPGRPLWLLSIQVTRGEGPQAVSLSGLIGEIGGRLAARREQFHGHLKELGWRYEDSDLYQRRYIPRSAPMAYEVDDAFPALTQPRLSAAVPSHHLVSGVSYRVDVTGWAPGDPGGPIARVLNGTEFGDA